MSRFLEKFGTRWILHWNTDSSEVLSVGVEFSLSECESLRTARRIPHRREQIVACSYQISETR